MLVIVCPHCGPRNNDEFTYQGELVKRPPVDTDPVSWRRYLYMKRNEAGWQTERWFHVSGCRRFLEVERNTITDDIRRVSEVGAS